LQAVLTVAHIIVTETSTALRSVQWCGTLATALPASGMGMGDGAWEADR